MIAAILVAALSGAAMSFQGALNTLLSKRITLVGTSAAVHVIGAIVTGVVIAGALLLFRDRLPASVDPAATPWYAYLGGVLSVIIIGGVAFAFSVTGAGLGVSVILTAQLAAAMVLDHFGLFELKRIPITWLRAAGVALLIIGTRLVAR